jgi:arylesterase/paraoxonase
MPSLLLRTTAIGAVVIGILYQFIAKAIIFDTLGYGRAVQDISMFRNARCQKIDDLGLEGCEDMWLNDRTGLLYMSCSNSRSRVHWLPALVALCYNLLYTSSYKF